MTSKRRYVGKSGTERYSILRETFCIYCQRDYIIPDALQAHVHDEHPGSIAEASINRARENTK